VHTVILRRLLLGRANLLRGLANLEGKGFAVLTIAAGLAAVFALEGAQAALVNTTCLEYLQSAEVPIPSASSHSTPRLCLDGTGVGSASSPPPAGEYLDLASGIVWKDTGQGLQPSGLGLPQQGYVGLTTKSEHGLVVTDGRQCQSTEPFGCNVNECHSQVCQALHVAVLGCYPIKLTFQYSRVSPWPEDYYLPGKTYPAQCTPGPIPVPALPPRPSLPIRAVGGAWTLSPVGTSLTTTLLDDSFEMMPGCWYFDGEHTQSWNDPSFGTIVPATLVTSIYVGNDYYGQTVLQIC
jgi:hypothetical protein